MEMIEQEFRETGVLKDRAYMPYISGQQSVSSGDSPGQAISYFYNGKGERLKAVRNGETTFYIHDLNNNVLTGADGNKNITRLYVHGQGLLGMVTSTDQVYSYHFNVIGSTVAITDHNQNVVNAYAYNPFGIILNQTEALPQPFKYVGQFGVMAESCELTAECFLYMRVRYYDPKAGRFISEDPIGFDGGTVNLYEYVGNQPLNYNDPVGLLWPINCGKYIYYMATCSIKGRECKEKQCQNDENTDSSALWKKCIQDIPECQKMVESCGKCGIGKK